MICLENDMTDESVLTRRQGDLLKVYGAPAYSSHRIPIVSSLLVTLYALLVTLGVLFNVIVVVALLQHRTLTNITNIFVLTLAFSDIVLCSVNMPVQAYYEIMEPQDLGSTAVCRTLFFFFGLPMYVSCLTIMVIAIDRHHMIINPLGRRMSGKVAVSVIIAVVIFSVINSIPVAMYTRGSKVAGGNQYCIEDWPNQGFRLAYSVAIFSIHFLFPLFVSAVLYLRIYFRLSQRAFKKKDSDRKKRTNKILMAVVACFAICWTPWCIYSLLLELQAYLKPASTASRPLLPPHITGDSRQSRNCSTLRLSALLPNPPTGEKAIMLIPSKHLKLLDLLFKLFTMCSACVNPFLYGWLNEPIRDSMMRLWRRILRRSPEDTNQQKGRMGLTRIDANEFGNDTTVNYTVSSQIPTKLDPSQLALLPVIDIEDRKNKCTTETTVIVNERGEDKALGDYEDNESETHPMSVFANNECDTVSPHTVICKQLAPVPIDSATSTPSHKTLLVVAQNNGISRSGSKV